MSLSPPVTLRGSVFSHGPIDCDAAQIIGNAFIDFFEPVVQLILGGGLDALLL